MSKPLLENFYTETASTDLSAENAFTASVVLNPVHQIYKGHFPEIPVAPGVVLIRLVQEILENKIKRPLYLKEGSNIKFLAMINPLKENTIVVSYTVLQKNQNFEVTAHISGKDITYVKFRGKFTVK